MALWNIKSRVELGPALILAPERYDPRRNAPDDESRGVALHEICESVRRTVSPASGDPNDKFVVLDTSDASEGILSARKPVTTRSRIGSTKKLVPIGTVIISRLRPYLRQVAYVDREVTVWEDGVSLACSTEFYVLQCKNGSSAAFLIPFLLSKPIQTVLAASQEGGHHPRFDEATLLGLRIPKKVLERKDRMSAAVEQAVRAFRQSMVMLDELVNEVDSCA